MDLHFILQVFRAIELKLGLQLKDLKKNDNQTFSVEYCFPVPTPLATIWLQKIVIGADFPALGMQSGHVKEKFKKKKRFVNGHPSRNSSPVRLIVQSEPPSRLFNDL